MELVLNNYIPTVFEQIQRDFEEFIVTVSVTVTYSSVQASVSWSVTGEGHLSAALFIVA